MPSQAHAGAISCSDGYLEDHQTNTGMYADVGFELVNYCTSDNDLYVTGTSWGPGGSYGWGGGLFWQMGYGDEYITVNVSDGEDSASFMLHVHR